STKSACVFSIANDAIRYRHSEVAGLPSGGGLSCTIVAATRRLPAFGFDAGGAGDRNSAIRLNFPPFRRRAETRRPSARTSFRVASRVDRSNWPIDALMRFHWIGL